MDILEDPEFKMMYQKYKNRVKLWESRFTEKHGRQPNKNDIKAADIKIKESYKMYWKLKTRALEETLTDITFDNAVQDNVSNVHSLNMSSEEIKIANVPVKDDYMQGMEDTGDKHKNNVENLEQQKVESISKKGIEHNSQGEIEDAHKKDAENIDPQECKNQSIINNSIVDEDDYKNVKDVWGHHLSKENEQNSKKKDMLIGRSSSFQLSQNKFASSNFTKRNPRKSTSMLKLKTKLEKNSNTSMNTLEQVANMEVNDAVNFDTTEGAKSIFCEQVKVTYVEPKATMQSLSTLQQVINGHTVNRNINPGWLDRCAKQNNLEYAGFDQQRLSGTSDSGIESMESSIYSPKESVQATTPCIASPVSDDEDFVCNSDSEEVHKQKRIRNFKPKFSDQENPPSKRFCAIGDENLPMAYKVENQTDNVNRNTIEEKPNNYDILCITATKSNSINTNVNTEINFSKTNDKCGDKIKSITQTSTTKAYDNENTDNLLNKQSEPHRKVRRRIKKVSPGDSDVKFNKCDEQKDEEDENKRKVNRRTTRCGSNSEVKMKNTKRKKNSKSVQDSLEINASGTETKKDLELEIYGVETLEAIPRFVVNKSIQGDLVQQFAHSVSTKTTNLSASVVLKKSSRNLTNKEKLEKKVAEGKVNENFVRINLKKKVFVRGKKNFNFSKYKKNQWKQRKKDLGSSEGSLAVADFVEKNGGILKCFKCGDVGHFSRYCPNTKGDDLIPLDEVDESSQFPTLEEAQKMASQNAIIAHGNRMDRLPEQPSCSFKTDIMLAEKESSTDATGNDLWEPIADEEFFCGHKMSEDLLQKLLPPKVGTVQPLYKINDQQSITETPPEVFDALRKFGHETFRPGQEKAVMRILSGQSTLVTLSTGSGKSLCYQLPAYLYSKYSHCITLVISPLVSLMDDQVTNVASFLSAACLHTGQTDKVKDNVMQMVKQGKVNILLISPEAAVAGEKTTGFGALLRQLPPIAFACIDEAHCISQWSHNFRPSYLMVCRVLKEKLGVKTVLGLTATATKSTAESIADHLGIDDRMAGIISDIPMPRNLILSVSKDERKDEALIELLLGERYRECDSIIIYCTRREECVRIAGLVRASLQDPNTTKHIKSTLSSIAEAYHAGLSAHRRRSVQKAFMNGKTRIIVATVAFGMGLNKPDIRGIIHYNMPGTFEAYVQEVGRAGRDGLPSHCHLFLSIQEDTDKWELRRHIYANGVDRHTIRRLLQKVFIPCSCAKLRGKVTNYRCPGHEVAIPIDETVAALDVSPEIILTLLCYLELHPKKYINVLSSVYVRARISSYSGPQGIKQAAQSSPPLAMAIALDLKNGIHHENDSVIEFPVVDVASAIGWDSGVVKSHLKSLEWKTVNAAPKRSAISVRYGTLGLRVKAPGDLTESELDEALDALVSRAQNQETAALQQLETIGVTLHKFSALSVKQCIILHDEMVSKSDELKGVIRTYFDGRLLLDINHKQQTETENEQIVCDVRNLIVSYRDNNFTGRAIARIFHGIQSPNYPAYVWNKCRFWRAHLAHNFHNLIRIATREILALR